MVRESSLFSNAGVLGGGHGGGRTSRGAGSIRLAEAFGDDGQLKPRRSNEMETAQRIDE